MKKILKNIICYAIAANILFIASVYGMLPSRTTALVAHARVMQTTAAKARSFHITPQNQADLLSNVKTKINTAFGLNFFTPKTDTNPPRTSTTTTKTGWLVYLAALLGISWETYSMTKEKESIAQDIQELTSLFNNRDKTNLNNKDKNYIGAQLIKLLKKNNPEQITMIFNEVKKTIDPDSLYMCLEYLIAYEKIDPTIEIKLIPFIKQNFLKLSDNRHGRCIIREIFENHSNCNKQLLRNNSSITKEFLPLILQHSSELSRSDVSINIMETMIINNSYAEQKIAKEFLPFVKQHILKLSTSDAKMHILNTMIKNDPDITKELLPLVIQHYLPISQTNAGLNVIDAITDALPEAAKDFFPLIKQNFQKISSDYPGMRIIENIIKNTPERAKELSLLILHSNVYNPTLLNMVMKYASCNKEIETVITKKAHTADDFTSLLSAMIYCNHCPEYNSESIEKTPSRKHLKKYLNSIISTNDYSLKLSSPEIQKTMMAALNTEELLMNNDHETFFHGRGRSHAYEEKIFALLRAHAKNEDVNDNFVFTHIRKEETNKQEITKRESLLEGPKHCIERKDPKGLLFTNHFLFGNCTESIVENCSPAFMARNFNWKTSGYASTKIKDIFSMFNADAVYEEFKEKLLAQQEQYNQVSKYGQMLAIGIKKEKVDQCVYLSTDFGVKITDPIEGLNLTDKTSILLRTLNATPIEKNIQYPIAVSFDKGGLNNRKGVIVRVVDPADHDLKSRERKIAADQENAKLFAAMTPVIIAQFKKNNLVF